MDVVPQCRPQFIKNMPLEGKNDEKMANLQCFFHFFTFFSIFGHFWPFWPLKRLNSIVVSTDGYVFIYFEGILGEKTPKKRIDMGIFKIFRGGSIFGCQTKGPSGGYFWPFLAIFWLRTKK